MIEVQNLKKHYGAVKSVDGVSFRCLDGQITGLLGPNGAGKTTTLRMICGLIKPLAGRVLIDGQDVAQSPEATRRLLGVQSDMTGVYPRLTDREQLRYYGGFYGLRGAELEQCVNTIIQDLQMHEIADRRAEGFSRGQRQKIVLGRALVHNPPNVLMDEPTNGLDVLAVRETRDYIRRLKEQGRCVLFSTHYMDEAERLCDYIAIIVRGQLAAFGTPSELMAQTGQTSLEEAFVSLAGGREGLLHSEQAAQREN